MSKDPYPAVDRWLDQVETALGDGWLLLCLDEFEKLEAGIAAGRFDLRLLDMLRNIVQHRQRIAVLLAGSHNLDELPPYWASALINTFTLPISFLDESDARDLSEQPVADFPPIYTAAAVDRIVQITHCQPYLAQLLCGLLVQSMNSARRIPPQIPLWTRKMWRLSSPWLWRGAPTTSATFGGERLGTAVLSR